VTTPSGGIPSGPTGIPSSGSADAGRASVVVADYPDYAAAQRAVDYLSDQNFPVEHTAIVGTDLRLVENVLGRLTVGRAAVAGAGGGAWFGLFIGLLFGIFSTYNWFAVVATGLVAGAVWGAVFGAVAHAATRGQRDFTSRSSLQASQYAVTVDPGHAENARQLLVRLNWQASQPT
jgi:Heat induced stress protein YflT domain